MQPYLLLDAGGTLVFPDHRIIHRVALQHGYDVAEERLKHLMAEFIRHYDELLKSQGEADFRFFQWVLEQAGVEPQHAPLIIRQLQLIDNVKSLWTYTYPWVYETLASLAAQNYRMSVVSNADGRVRAELEHLRLADYFEEVFDSYIVGYAKPDPRLFEYAMTKLGLQPAEYLVVGDVYYVDVLGANRAGIAAVHLDPYSLYDGWAGYHIPTIAALPDFLATEGLDIQDERFFPLREDGAERA